MSFNELKPKTISKLEQSVINKICAGEVIHRPFNVVKELIENSLDANASNILVVLKNGGMKKIIIQDNGCGIRKEDLEIVCDRFTTSKLNNVDDLHSLTTFGFRGEALSSISTVSYLTITTKTTCSVCGYKAEFVDGKLKSGTSITPVAANNGTSIEVENLFYNIPTRKAALTSNSVEFNFVNELIMKYSILYSQKCSFTLKRHEDNFHAVNTKLSNTVLNNISILFCQNISSHLVPIEFSNEKLCYKVNGYFSDNDLNRKKFNFILFINSRLVECSSLKKSLKDMYKNYLMKSGNPFVLLILEINPKNIDVNVHPTKNEVCFLYQNEIISEIVSLIEDKLLNKDTLVIRSEGLKSKNGLNSSTSSAPRFCSDVKSNNQSFTSSKKESDISVNDSFKQSQIVEHFKPNLSTRIKSTNTNNNEKSFKKPSFHPSKQVRTDCKLQRIDSYLNKKQISNKRRRNIQLTSLIELRDEIIKSVDQNLLDIITKSTFVGCVDENYALIQHQLDLLLINIHNLNEELFYQIILLDFGNFDYFEFKNPLPISQLLSTYFNVNATSDTIEKNLEDKVKQLENVLMDKGDMLNDYFSIRINKQDRTIEAIPSLLDDYVPPMIYFPDFLYRLITNVDWEEEKKCFSSISTEITKFYCRKQVNLENTDSSFESWVKLVENNLYPFYKSLLFPSTFLKDRNSMIYITNITSLYKVFERC